jgi:hypothetical protein
LATWRSHGGRRGQGETAVGKGGAPPAADSGSNDDKLPFASDEFKAARARRREASKKAKPVKKAKPAKLRFYKIEAFD